MDHQAAGEWLCWFLSMESDETTSRWGSPEMVQELNGDLAKKCPSLFINQQFMKIDVAPWEGDEKWRDRKDPFTCIIEDENDDYCSLGRFKAREDPFSIDS